MNNIGKIILVEGNGFQEFDHPSFKNKDNINRRQELANNAHSYNISDN